MQQEALFQALLTKAGQGSRGVSVDKVEVPLEYTQQAQAGKCTDTGGRLRRSTGGIAMSGYGTICGGAQGGSWVSNNTYDGRAK